jgi:hypothetical protein
MRRLEQALYMDRNTIPNISTTSFAFEQNIKYNTRITIPKFIIGYYEFCLWNFETTLQCQW